MGLLTKRHPFKTLAERVLHGGHDLPPEDIARRYHRSIRNLINSYLPLCNRTTLLENSNPEPTVIIQHDEAGRTIVSQRLYEAFLRSSEEND